jgi:hypothetical protein
MKDNSKQRNRMFMMAEKMLNLEETDELEETLKCMLIDASEMTESCGGVFLSRQAIASVVVLWSRLYNQV